MSYTMYILVAACFCVSCLNGAAFTADSSKSAIQLLKHLGMTSNGVLKTDLKQAKGKRKSDSPVYYIKLPPMPHYYHNKMPPMVPLLPPPPTPLEMEFLHRLPIDFTNNGRPEVIRNWHYPPKLIQRPTNPTYSPLSSYQTQEGYVTNPFISNEVDSPNNPLLLPPELPLVTKKPVNKVPTFPLNPNMYPEGNSLISLKDHYTYNGRPTNVYIWSPQKTIRISKPKYRHPYFKHFNY